MTVADDMKITAIVPWFGSKRSMAELIVTELGKHKTYWNPCVGSFATEMAKPPARQEHVNDLHGELVNLARVIQDPRLGPQLYRRLRRVWNHEGIFYDAKGELAAAERGEGLFGSAPTLSPIDRAFNYFILSWMGRNGTAGTLRIDYQMAVRWTSGGGHGGTRFRNSVSSIPAWRRRMRNFTILDRDMFEILAKIEDEDGTAIYVDPPYIRDGKSRSGSCTYKHEFKPADHSRLATALLRFKRARVVVSYYDHADLAALYPGWTIVKHTVQKNLHVQNRRGAGACDAPEILLLNGPSYAKGPQ